MRLGSRRFRLIARRGAERGERGEQHEMARAGVRSGGGEVARCLGVGADELRFAAPAQARRDVEDGVDPFAGGAEGSAALIAGGIEVALGAGELDAAEAGEIARGPGQQAQLVSASGQRSGGVAADEPARPAQQHPHLRARAGPAEAAAQLITPCRRPHSAKTSIARSSCSSVWVAM